jgi:ribosome-associated protein
LGKSQETVLLIQKACYDLLHNGGEGLESLELAHLLVDTILDKKGSDITLLDLREQAIFADYFLICNGENDRQLRAMANGVAQDAKQKASALAKSIEGSPESGWVLVDFGDLLVHLFSPDMRHYYDLEGLWDSAHVVMRMQ